jgi:ElaB/YqjD/DUF883 family membrane-anchored ribosome-binding protein
MNATELATEQISKEKLMEDLHMVVVDAEELLKATANQTGERIAAARLKAGESLHVAKTRLLEAHASVAEKAKVVAKSADTYVHDNPWQAIGVAGAMGLALGVLISRR